jgi:hypothetical protein
MWTGVVWLRIGTGGELLNAGKLLSGLTSSGVASQVVLSSIELVSTRGNLHSMSVCFHVCYLIASKYTVLVIE